MRKISKGVTESLINSATQEFLKEGFNKASLRKIASQSGVSTNSIYTRFKDKEGLFDAIVKDVADGLMDIYLDSISKAKHRDELNLATQEGGQGTYLVLDYVYEHFTVFQLIFCHSSGSKYEHFLDHLGEIEETYYHEFVKKYGNQGYQVDDFFIHVFCRTGWQLIYEVVSHNCSYEEARSFMNSTIIFNVAGWKAVMGIKE